MENKDDIWLNKNHEVLHCRVTNLQKVLVDKQQGKKPCDKPVKGFTVVDKQQEKNRVTNLQKVLVD